MVTSTTITATWEKPRDPNGIIQGYRLLITLQTPYLGLYNETFELGPDTFSYEFSDLHPFALYRIVLRAETSAGLGTETTYMPMTQEAGMNLCVYVSFGAEGTRAHFAASRD